MRELEEEVGLSVAKAQYGEGLVLGLWEVNHALSLKVMISLSSL